MALLTLAERQQLKAAHDKAMQQDPSLESKMQALRKEMDDLRKAMRDAMIKADPTVEPILEKIAPSKRAWGGAPPSANSATNTVVMTNAVAMATPNAKARGIPPGFATLSPAEQQQIEALHEKVKTDPAVLAARNTLMQATTPETRRAAFEGLHQAIHDAMIKADPSIEGLLEKLHPGGVPPPPLPPQPPPQ
jgi:collagenase-like PrtC family protease